MFREGISKNNYIEVHNKPVLVNVLLSLTHVRPTYQNIVNFNLVQIYSKTLVLLHVHWLLQNNNMASYACSQANELVFIEKIQDYNVLQWVHTLFDLQQQTRNQLFC